MSSLANTKVHELFRVMHDSELTHEEYSAYVAMLRDLLNTHVVSGRMLVQDFLENAFWTNALTDAKHADEDIQGFHEFLVKTFVPATNPNHPQTQSTTQPYPNNTPTQTTTRSTVSTQTAHSPSTITHKQKWQQLMRPLAAEFATAALPTNTLVEFIWQSLTDDGALDTLYAMGRTLLRKAR